MAHERDILDRLLAVASLLTLDTARFALSEGMTEARVHLLWELHRSGPVAQRPLATALGVTPRTVTGLVDALEASGHVVRAAHPTDRRASVVTLTSAGEAFAERLVAMHADLATQLVGDLSPRRRDGLATGLDHVLARLHSLLQDQP
ncbi:MarR family winged helix-turn-helix transcriptional regulator [Aquipuribacter hungaricus]|uniref:MarR family winged helix-turn-helix transcriptional regulator n=1 Tax=Aquipuribacter hungaricus TaxID=545624 RepID=A0ABV7WDM0_9MICO